MKHGNENAVGVLRTLGALKYGAMRTQIAVPMNGKDGQAREEEYILYRLRWGDPFKTESQLKDFIMREKKVCIALVNDTIANGIRLLHQLDAKIMKEGFTELCIDWILPSSQKKVLPATNDKTEKTIFEQQLYIFVSLV